MFSILKLVLPLFFGSSSNGRGVVTSVVDAAERWFPSAATRNNRADKDLEAHESSQASARKMQMVSHDSWLDILIDAWNRAIRPLITTGLIGIWFGWWPAPNLVDIHPFYLQMTMMAFTFWFGGRFVTKDIPKAVELWNERQRKKQQEVDEELSAYDDGEYEEPTINNPK